VSRARRECDCPRRGSVLASFLLVLVSGWSRANDVERKDSGPYCGLYCVYGALQAIGKDVPFETLLRPKYLSAREGSSVKELRQAVIDAGAHAVALSGLGAESLRSARQPMLLHVASDGQLQRYDHWVLFCGMEDGKARLLDAPNPMELVPLSDILARWAGTALVVSDRPIGVRSIEVGEGGFHLGVILLTLVLVCLVDYSLRRRNPAPASEVSRRGVSRVFGLLSQSVILLGCSLGLGIGLHVIDDTGFLRNPAAARYVAAANMSHFFPRLGYNEARRFIVQRRGAIIDARLPESFQNGSIPGALNVPVNASTAERREKMKDIPRQTPVLIYCQSNLCEYDETLGALLARDGFESISLYPGGWLEWEKHEHPGQVGQSP
jgi:rhodanese-related sulfurtransferase